MIALEWSLNSAPKLCKSALPWFKQGWFALVTDALAAASVLCYVKQTLQPAQAAQLSLFSLAK